MSILKKKDYWLSIGLFFIFFIYQIFNITNYYLFQYGDVKSDRIVGLLLNSIDVAVIASVLFPVLLILFLHILVASMAYFSWQTITCKKIRNNRLYFTAFILGIILLSTLWNWIFFPGSLAMPPSNIILSQTHSIAVFYIATTAYGIFFAWSLYVSIIKQGIRLVKSIGKKEYVLFVIAALFVTGISTDFDKFEAATKDKIQPNIILIGVDSLRPDHLAYFGFEKGLTPHIDGFLKQAAVFEDTMTPFARTYPAWMSILSGQYPIIHGGRYNLYPTDEVAKDNLLPAVLQKNNYETFYITDEVRFANFTKEYGFDVLSAPQMGVLDFILGMTLDFVYINFLSKTNLFGYLLPYTYANRAASSVYDSGSFTQRTEATVDSIGHSSFFMVAHHCLPHWPYYEYMESHIRKDLKDKYRLKLGTPVAYLNALRLADQQVGRLLEKLKLDGHLENSIVVILSDHGEGFGIEKDTLSSVGSDHEGTHVGHGHGTFALSKSQNNVLLAMQMYKNGKPVWESGIRSNESSLIDITPTISQLLSLSEHGYEGVSLLPFLQDKSLIGKSRFRYVESGLTSSSVDTRNPNEAKLFQDYSKFYHVRNDKRIELKKEYLMSLIKTKQRAVFKNNKGLMYSNMRGAKFHWLLSDYSDNSIWKIDNPDKHSVEVKHLKNALCEAYMADKVFYQDACIPSS